jgi:ketosteroid isomerase-like protein
VSKNNAFIDDRKAAFSLIAFGCCLALGLAPRTARAQSRVTATTLISPPAPANDDPQGERELRAILDELGAAVLQHDAKVVEKYYSPDYVMTFSDGRRGGVENSLHVLTDTSRNEWHMHDVSNERFTFYGGTAIVTFTAHSQWVARTTRKQFDVREHVTQTWIRRDGRWTLVATHVTTIDPSQQ